MSKVQIIHMCSAPAGSYAVVIEPVLDRDYARVVPVVGFAHIEGRIGLNRTAIMPLITDSLSHPMRHAGGPHLLIDIFPLALTWQVFAPGENAMRWAEAWQEASGHKIDEWDERAWWMESSPLIDARS